MVFSGVYTLLFSVIILLWVYINGCFFFVLKSPKPDLTCLLYGLLMSFFVSGVLGLGLGFGFPPLVALLFGYIMGWGLHWYGLDLDCVHTGLGHGRKLKELWTWFWEACIGTTRFEFFCNGV